MMSLPKRYDKRIKAGLAMRAAWLPGANIRLGSVMLRDNGIFNIFGHVEDFGVTNIRNKPLADKNLSFTSQGTKLRAFQAGAEVPDLGKLDGDASAKLDISFERNFSYILRTPTLSGQFMENILPIARKLHVHPDWRHRDYFVAWKVLGAKDFTFLGSEAKDKKISFSGTGNAILSFLSFGASANLQSTGSIDLKITGAEGDVALGLFRIRRKNGLPDYV